MSSGPRVVVVVLVLAAVGGAILWVERHRPARTPPAAPVVTPLPSAPPPSPPSPAPVAPAIRHPVTRAASSSDGGLPPLADADAYLKKVVTDLLGRKAVVEFLRLDDFARRFVATVDNLGGEHAAVHLWPVNPTAGPFETQASGGGEGAVISPRNADRYVALAHFAEAIDVLRAVALYRHLYPLFQRTFEDLGSPGKYFNDRVVEVIDELLATPDPTEPIKVKRVQIDAATPSPAGAGLYLFEDPTLERRSAGQKVLLRAGRDNAARLKAKLVEIRRELTTAATSPTR